MIYLCNEDIGSNCERDLIISRFPITIQYANMVLRGEKGPKLVLIKSKNYQKNMWIAELKLMSQWMMRTKK